MFEAESTKQKIFEAAAALFSTIGYYNTSMREIANTVGINPASIYNHFEGKEDILDAIFDYYAMHRNNSIIPLDELLSMVGNRHPHEILLSTIALYPKETLPMMSKAMLIANFLRTTNERAETVMADMINLAADYDKPLLQKMLDLEEIEPMDIGAFAELHTNHCFACAMRFYGSHYVSDAHYVTGLEMLFSLVIPNRKKYGQ